MTDAVFDVTPHGIFGMNKLAQFLNNLKESGEIVDWHPTRAVSGSKGARYIVQFINKKDAGMAEARWIGAEKPGR